MKNYYSFLFNPNLKFLLKSTLPDDFRKLNFTKWKRPYSEKQINYDGWVWTTLEPKKSAIFIIYFL